MSGIKINEAKIGLAMLTGLIMPAPYAQDNYTALNPSSPTGLSNIISDPTWAGKPISKEELFTPVVKNGTVELPIADVQDATKFSPIWDLKGAAWAKSPDKITGVPFTTVRGLTTPLLAANNTTLGIEPATATTKYFVITSEMQTLKFGLAGNGITSSYASLAIDGKTMNRDGAASVNSVSDISWDLSKYIGQTAQVSLRISSGGWLGVVGAPEIKTPAQVGPSLYLSRSFRQRVTATLTTSVTSPSTNNGTLRWFAPIPPNNETQQTISYNLKCLEYPYLKSSVVNDVNDASRKYLKIELPINSQTFLAPVTFEITYTLDLFNISLTRSAKVSNQPTTPINESINKAALLETSMINFKSSEFLQYLNENDLTKKTTESNLAFAYRAFKIIARDLARRTKPDSPAINVFEMKLSKICQPSNTAADCGACSILFTGVMRANNVPCILKVGRWALNEELGYGQYHVKAAFLNDIDNRFMDVDQTFARNDLQAGRSPEDAFSKHQGIFITMHENTDVAPDGYLQAGRQSQIPINQFATSCYIGSSFFNPKFEDHWKVQSINK